MKRFALFLSLLLMLCLLGCGPTQEFPEEMFGEPDLEKESAVSDETLEQAHEQAGIILEEAQKEAEKKQKALKSSVKKVASTTGGTISYTYYLEGCAQDGISTAARW